MPTLLRSPVSSLQAARGARFAAYHGWEVAEQFGDPRREYDAVRGDAGALDVSYLGKLSVTGRDRVRYLHNMLSNDVKGLAPGRGCYATLLSHQGRIESDCFVYAFPEELRLECGPASRERLEAQLRKFVIADQVDVRDRSAELAILSLQGPAARARMEETVGCGLEGLEPLDHLGVARGGAEWVLARRDRTGSGGYDLWLPAADAGAVWSRWVDELGAAPVGHRALDWLRTEAGIPWYGADMDEMTLPLEMGLEHAISMTKGCYRGQEIVARIVHRGHLNRRLAGIAVGDAEPPPRGAEVRAAGAEGAQGTRVGEVTSAAYSPRLDKPLALAVLRLEHRAPGTRVEVLYGGAARRGTVVELPLV